MEKDIKKKREVEIGLEMKRIKRESEKKKVVEELKECTFQPNIRKNNGSLSRKNSLKKSLEHVERLYNWQNENLKNKLKL